MWDVLRPYWTKYVIGAILRMRKGRKYPPDLAETIRRNPERRKVSCWNASSHSCPKSNCSRWNNRRSYGIHSSPFDPIDHKVCAALTDRSAPRESPGDLSEPWHGRSLRKMKTDFKSEGDQARKQPDRLCFLFVPAGRHAGNHRVHPLAGWGMVVNRVAFFPLFAVFDIRLKIFIDAARRRCYPCNKSA